ncbi:VanZ family protein [bacterium]|nr:VanZ family protein [bacterium]
MRYPKPVNIWMAVFLVYLAILTLSPFQFSVAHLRQSLKPGIVQQIYEWVYFKDYDLVTNLLLFMPFGFLLRLDAQTHQKSWSWKRAVILGGLISLFIECAQLFLERSTNGMDTVMNMAGSGAGFYMARSMWNKLRRAWHFVHHYRQAFLTAGLLFSSLFISLICMLPMWFTTPAHWNPDYPLLFGNERTMDRPWLGEIHFVTLYNHAPAPAEAKRWFETAGDPAGIAIRKRAGAIALYDFAEGAGDTLHDRSGILPLIRMIGDSVCWLEGGGVLSHGGIFRSLDPVNKITEAVQNSGAFAVEVLCSPGNLDQAGPARIVSLSANTQVRNFALAQQGRQVHLRFRSALGGWNGSDVNLRADHVLNDTDPVHLIATFDHGVEQLYVNGRRHPGVIYGHIDYMPVMAGLGRGILPQITFILALFFPAAVAAACLFRRHRFMMTWLLITLLSAAVDLVYIIAFHAPLCLRLIVTAWGAAVLGVIFVHSVRPGQMEGDHS